MLELKNLMLGDPPLTLAVAESVTCGRVQARIGAVHGASTFFLGGIVAYALKAKARHLGVDLDEARQANGVSQAIAEQMALGACALFDARVGLATTGYAEPSPEHRVITPFAWWAIARRLDETRAEVTSGMIECPGAHRTAAQEAISVATVNALIRFLRRIRT